MPVMTAHKIPKTTNTVEKPYLQTVKKMSEDVLSYEELGRLQKVRLRKYAKHTSLQYLLVGVDCTVEVKMKISPSAQVKNHTIVETEAVVYR
ncbi:MAG: hypothetical protein WCV85_06285 [Patescibacteria group bacterium]|jgi:hypothetical protein